MGSRQGFFAFLLAATFLLALVAAAAVFSSSGANSRAFPGLVSLHLSQVSIKEAFYSSLSGSARAVLAASGGGIELRERMRAGLYARAMNTEAELAAAGYHASFWCGGPSEQSISFAAENTGSLAQPQIPSGALPLSNPLCMAAFDADLVSRKIHLSGVGFCAYYNATGIGQCAHFPDSYEVEF